MIIDVARVHPILVHFPIVLFIVAVVLDIFNLSHRGDLSEGQCLPLLALGALFLGSLFAVAAAMFGDIALDKAVELGFPRAPLEQHEEFGLATMWIFIGLTAVRAVAWWRRFSLNGWPSWVLCGLGVAGVAVLITAAYFGGELVYKIGVNVAPVKP
ncbi:MAG TPA: DUF2231 domain-containing protein [Burkholderiales bacterium]|nr:DUF2231 domain-containing protein [Burkholderiales bacterium]